MKNRRKGRLLSVVAGGIKVAFGGPGRKPRHRRNDQCANPSAAGILKNGAPGSLHPRPRHKAEAKEILGRPSAKNWVQVPANAQSRSRYSFPGPR